MSEAKRGRGYVYAIQYHIVWCVKYRYKVLSGDLDKRLKEILQQIATDNHFTITEIESDADHIHLLIAHRNIPSRVSLKH